MKPAAIRVSIVEDDTAIRESLNALFIFEEGMQVFSVHGSAEEAMDRFAVDAPDVVIMDINLPGATGIECVRELGDRCPGTQFLMYTVHDDDHKVFEALKAGANGYILKSSSPDQILEAVRDLYQGGSPMSAHVARRVVQHFRPLQERSSFSDGALSQREHDVLELLAKGLLYKEIAAQLGISTGTVKQHIHKIYEKLHVQNRTEAVNRFFGR